MRAYALTALVESAEAVGVITGAGTAAVLAYPHFPTALPAALHLPATGIGAFLGGVVASIALDPFLAPARRLLAQARYTDRPAPAAPATLTEALIEITQVTEDDAAARAAQATHSLDSSSTSFLHSEERWRGYENGEATCYLAPGVHLHYRADASTYGPRHHFTLLTGNSPEEFPVTTVLQLREHLAQRAKALALPTV
ncbi:hypothetical protein ACVW0K_007230 [Streptomyces filamentosus]